MEFLIVLSSICILLFFFVFFLFQAIERGRSPLDVFFGPVTNAEFKVLLDYVVSAEIIYEQQTLDKHWYIGKRYTVVKRFMNDKLYLNGVGLSFFQERALVRAINRNALRANLLTPAGQVLYGEKSKKN